jgi:hypothetical protein
MPDMVSATVAVNGLNFLKRGNDDNYQWGGLPQLGQVLCVLETSFPQCLHFDMVDGMFD